MAIYSLPLGLLAAGPLIDWAGSARRRRFMRSSVLPARRSSRCAGARICGRERRGRMTTTSGRMPIAAIRSLIEDALTAAGLPREDAGVCAKLMGEADLTGADAHGVFRLRNMYGASRRAASTSARTSR